MYRVILLSLACAHALSSVSCVTIKHVTGWPGHVKCSVEFEITQNVNGWEVVFNFTSPIVNLQIWRAKLERGQGREWVVKNWPYNKRLRAGTKLYMQFIVKYEGVIQPTGEAYFKPTTSAPKPTTPNKGVKVISEWMGGLWAQIVLEAPCTLRGWTVHLQFSQAPAFFWSSNADVKQILEGKRLYVLKNKGYNGNLQKGAILQVPFGLSFGSTAPIMSAHILECKTTSATNPSVRTRPTTTPLPSTTTQTTTKPTPTTTIAKSTTAPTTKTPTTTTRPTTTKTPTTTTPTPTTTKRPTTPTTTPTTPKRTNVPTTSTTTSRTQKTASPPKYDYDEVLEKSILFYEAQRSGKLPSNNRVPWRGDSALGDGRDIGLDLSGGWYDAGDFVKFGLPLASSVTLLTWGLVEYSDAYRAAGQLDYMYDCIKWPLDYLLKTYPQRNKFVAQVGSGDIDHNVWERPEDLTARRPTMTLNASAPGSDVAGETAAALAAGAIAFRERDPNYSRQLLAKSRAIYTFAETYKGKYSDHITDGAKFYKSSGYQDELAWGAAWLYRATYDTHYFQKAKSYYSGYIPWAFSWDEKYAGTQLLLYIITKEKTYRDDVTNTLNSWLPGGRVKYTPKGLAWRHKWGSLVYSGNMAALATIAAKHDIRPDTYLPWARSQIHYALGDTGRSFVVGFGTNPPQRPHHNAASCPSPPAPCGFTYLYKKAPNPHILYGALVGGPDEFDRYTDDRTDYVTNEVGCTYNAGFQTAVAGLRYLHSH